MIYNKNINNRNKKNNKHIKKCICILVIIIAIILLINTSNSNSNSNIILEKEYVISGDTLWSIAKSEQETNIYFKGKDIREIIGELKEINNIKDSNLKVGQEILIPKI